MSRSTSRSWHWWVNAIAYVAVIIIGIVLFFGIFNFRGRIFGVLDQIAAALAYVVVAACSFVYVAGKSRRKNGLLYLILWIIAVVLITLYYVIPLVRG
jgi:type IV secretory pathway VirB2 component (pilin)